MPGYAHLDPARGVRVALVLNVFPLAGITTHERLVDRIPSGPRPAAVSQTMTYPAAGGQLWQNATHNLTAGLRDDAAWGRAYEGGYLTVNQSGSLYSNTSLVPPGTFNATYSFTADAVGQLATDWTTDGIVSEGFVGHSKVFNLSDNSATTSLKASIPFYYISSPSLFLFFCSFPTILLQINGISLRVAYFRMSSTSTGAGFA